MQMKYYSTTSELTLRWLTPKYTETSNKYQKASKALQDLMPDLKEDIRNRLDSILKECGKCVVYTIQDLKISNMPPMPVGEFLKRVMDAQQKCFNFCKDIEKKVNL